MSVRLRAERLAVGFASVTAGVLVVVLAAGRSAAWPQCGGQIYAVASGTDDSLVVVVGGAEQNCGCKDNRLIQPPTSANHKASHANALAAALAGLGVSVSYDYFEDTPCYGCGPCRLQEISIFP